MNVTARPAQTTNTVGCVMICALIVTSPRLDSRHARTQMLGLVLAFIYAPLLLEQSIAEANTILKSNELLSCLCSLDQRTQGHGK